MEKKIIKKILIILILLMVLIVAYRLINTYALFYSEGEGTVKQDNATWTIYLNDKNIASSNTFEVDTFNLDKNSHVADGKIAPSSSGSFNIVIDPKSTNVSIRYTIKLDSTQISNQKITIVSINETSQGNELIKTDLNTYEGVMPLSQIQAGKTNNIEIKVKWENDEANNEEDTKIGKEKNYNVKIPINVTVTQYLGEKILPYNEQETEEQTANET